MGRRAAVRGRGRRRRRFRAVGSQLHGTLRRLGLLLLLLRADVGSAQVEDGVCGAEILRLPVHHEPVHHRMVEVVVEAGQVFRTGEGHAALDFDDRVRPVEVRRSFALPDVRDWNGQGRRWRSRLVRVPFPGFVAFLGEESLRFVVEVVQTGRQSNGARSAGLYSRLVRPGVLVVMVVVLLLASVPVAVLFLAAAPDAGLGRVGSAGELEKPAGRLLDVAVEADGAVDDALSRRRRVALAGRRERGDAHRLRTCDQQ